MNKMIIYFGSYKTITNLNITHIYKELIDKIKYLSYRKFYYVIINNLNLLG